MKGREGGWVWDLRLRVEEWLGSKDGVSEPFNGSKDGVLKLLAGGGYPSAGGGSWERGAVQVPRQSLGRGCHKSILPIVNLPKVNSLCRAAVFKSPPQAPSNGSNVQSFKGSKGEPLAGGAPEWRRWELAEWRGADSPPTTLESS